MAQDTDRKIPPYSPYESWNRLLGRMKDAQPLPKPMDSSFWRQMKFSGSLTSALKSTLMALGLTLPDGTPTSDLEELVKSDGLDRQKVLGHVFARAYEPILAKLDLPRATPKQLRDEFATLGASGETNKKAVAFFLAVAKEVGQPLHPHLQLRRARSPSAATHKGEPRKQHKSKEEPTKLPKSQAPEDYGLKHLHPSLAGLLSTLPPAAETWDKDSKERFKQAFNALLEVLYPTA